ncbi:hypothetical protein Hanom_Chr01g00034911 [Helianthus anomalus]
MLTRGISGRPENSTTGITRPHHRRGGGGCLAGGCRRKEGNRGVWVGRWSESPEKGEPVTVLTEVKAARERGTRGTGDRLD